MKYVITTRSLNNGKFTNNPGVTRYLRVERNDAGQEVAHFLAAGAWAAEVLAAAAGNGVLIHVHGFNVRQPLMLERHGLIRAGLAAHGFGGVVVSFDWPANGIVFDYASDRKDAHAVAPRLALDAIGVLRQAAPGVKIDILAHSMGNLVTRHAFHRLVELGQATTGTFAVGEVLMVAADIAAKSMGTGAVKSKELYDFSTRITNYYSRADEILSLSQLYRALQAPRLGFQGLPDSVSPGTHDVYVQDYYNNHKTEWPNDSSISHNWHFLDQQFYRDAALTISGHVAAAMPTRAPTNLGNQALVG